MKSHGTNPRSFIVVHAVVFILLSHHIQKSYQGNHPIPYALSPVYLQYLEDVETRFYSLLKEQSLSDINDKQKLTIQRYLFEYEDSIRNTRNISRSTSNQNLSSSDHDYAEPDGYVLSSNPILSLQMINRFVRFFKKSKIYTTIPDETDLIEPDALPSGKEVEDAMEALLRLQFIYDLDAHEIANGVLHGSYTNAHLTARECFELGKFSQESAYFTLALQWYDVTLLKLQNADYKNDPTLSGIKKDSVMKAIKDTIEEHNQDYNENIEEGDMYSFYTPIQSTNYSKIAHLSLRKVLAQKYTGRLLPDEDPNYYQAMETNMMALCDGKNLQSEKIKSKLTCHFDTSRHPYWKINPLKIEVLNENPQVIQIYDIFNDAWISYLKLVSYHELQRAPMPPEATPRTAAYAWFEDTEIPAVPISKTVEFITGLNVVGTAAAESLQVAAYAFGGHVEPHYDSGEIYDLKTFEQRGPDDPEFSSRGDRVTTFLVYLNEVEQGGYTAFPLLGISIKPVKNSAVLWYTNLKNGQIDDWMLHAACPVIKGHKWIATKWTHINENILKRPCGLRPEE